MDKKIWEWDRIINSKGFTISSDKTFLLHSFVREAFATDAMFWARPLSLEATRAMLDNSLTLGLYKTNTVNEERRPIGMARLVTDYTTLAYLTDVYILETYRNLGLGRWIIHCCREIATSMPDLRFMVLLTGSAQAQELYRKELGMGLLDGRETKLACMGARSENLAEAAATSQQDNSDSL